MILYNQKQENFKFVSYFNTKEIKSQNKDMGLVYLLMNKLKPQMSSIALQKFIDSLQRLPINVLMTHPLIQNIDSESIIYQTEFNLSDFKIVKNLGAGAFGTCDLAIYIKTNEQVVLKSTQNKKSQDVEVALLQQICHPNIVRFYGSFTNERTYYIVMQYCNKGDLFDRLTKNTLPDKNSIFEWICQLSSAVYYMHSHKLMHRDIKPQNCLINYPQDYQNIQNIYLCDLGVGREITDYASTVVGTAIYMSLELYNKQLYSIPSDIFSLGLVFFNMVVGSHPFTSSPVDASKFYSYIKKRGDAGAYANYIKDPLLKDIINRMLYADPEKRITAEQICQIKEVQSYLYKHGLPGPGLPDILTNRKIIKIASQLPYQMFQIASLSTFKTKIQQLINGNQCFAPIILNSLPNYFINNLTCLSEKDQSNLYINQQIILEAEDLKSQLVKDLQIEDMGEINQNNLLCNKNNQIITDTCYCQVSNVTSEIQIRNNIVIICQALYLQESINITADTVIIIGTHLINEQKQTINIKAKKCIIAFQRHQGSNVDINIQQQDTKFGYYGATNSIQVKNGKIYEKLLIDVKQDENLAEFIKYLNTSYKQVFIGNQGFIVN